MIKQISYNHIQNITPSFANVPFKGHVQETLTHTNIGSCMNGYIGKVALKNEDGSTTF